MSTRNERSRGAALERLTEEARTGNVPGAPGVPRPVDWAAVEAKLFTRVDAEAKLPAPEDSRLWYGVAAALAIAAGAVVVLARHPQEPERAATRGPGTVSALVSSDGAGEVRVAGHVVAAGSVVASGDSVETTASARAVFRREGDAQGDGRDERVRWALEPSSLAVAYVHDAASRASPTYAAYQGALVVSLSKGAVEAEVSPVATGEAFAVDVEGTRIAVHGTHLRVARSGEMVTVDLSRGVVSIGDAPRAGSTYGELVTAPAHVEFSASAPRSSMRVDHAPSSIRPPVSLDLPVAAAPPPPALPAPALRPSPPAVASASQPLAPAPRPDVSGAPAVEPNPEAAIERAVEACILARPHGDEVTVTMTVTSTLTVTVGDDGLVHGAAQFFPPLPPEVQTCASATIFRVRFKEPGVVSIPIHVQR